MLNYVLGIGSQNAANAVQARTRHLERAKFLAEMSVKGSAFDPSEFPFVRSIAPKLPGHDDRADFLTGVELILAGIDARERSGREWP
ncbi:hypothetical protein [Rhizobium mesoamericanum]|uniref:hypothetical protein n=1 Tax=Rhizobium mesoamericanum TaxID=1079800 RepID=UPI00042A5A8F|nr:hypothetical protein [Rhizobium mesoamericanum]